MRNYTVLIVTDNDASHSFNFSRRWIIPGACVIIAVIILAVIGFNRVSSHDDLVNELAKLKTFKFEAMSVISDLDGADLLGHTDDFEAIIKSHFAVNDSIIPMTPPVEGYVTQGFSLDSLAYHPGIDIAAKVGDIVRAPADGVVVFSGVWADMGNLIILAHPKGFFTVYGHNDTNLVKQRDLVFYQQPICKVGDTGITEGPHLHFEIWKNNKVMDPRKLIDEYKRKDVSLN